MTIQNSITVINLSYAIREDGGALYTVTTFDSLDGDTEVTGLTKAEYDELYRRYYGQRGVIMSGGQQKDGSYSWDVGYISEIARQCAAPILSAVLDNRAIEFNDVMPAADSRGL